MQKEINVKKIQEICNAELLTKNIENIINKYTIDSRDVEINDCFISIKGKNSDNNKYLKMALEKGASVCLVQDYPIEELLENDKNK